MKRLVSLLLFALTLAFCLSVPAAFSKEKKNSGAAAKAPAAKVGPDYRIGPGDQLRISEWRNEDLTLPVVVLPDGYISFPLAGEIKASGKTVSELKAEIEQKLKVYIPEPTVSIMVTNVESLLIYIIGKVNRPGVFPLNTKVNVLQALAMAGGLNAFAKGGDIMVMRGEGESTQIVEFDYDEVSEGKHLEQNIVLQRGDVIVVP